VYDQVLKQEELTFGSHVTRHVEAISSCILPVPIFVASGNSEYISVKLKLL
jgi:hypothetical protein